MSNNNCLLILLLLLAATTNAAPLDSCTRIDSCTSCVNATDGFGFRCEWCSTSGSCGSENIPNECSADDTTLHRYNCPSDVSKMRYDEEFMRSTVLPMIASTYAEDLEKLSKSLDSCFGNQVEVINSYEIFCDETNITTCFGYTALLKEHNALVLVFRGTTTLFQLIDEGISFFLHPKVKFNVTNGVVDEYYLNAFYALWEKGMRRDVETILKTRPDVNFWFFGHSLGGGLASIASAYVAKTYELDASRAKLVTFGMPRIGDIELAQAHDQLVPDSWRIEHSKDPIPALPPRTYPDSIDAGSFHHKSEIWYPEGMARGALFEIGSSPDTVVGRSVFPFNIEDHMRYFDVVLETWHEKGCNP